MAWCKPLFFAVCLAALAGCAGTRLIDSEVRSFHNGTPQVAAASYQFERLPSQQADATGQAQRENWAAPVLQRLGWELVTEAPRYTVQLNVAIEQVLRSDPFFTRRWIGMPGGFFGASPLLIPVESVLYRFQMQVLVRDAQSRDVVYEATAQHTGPWRDQDQILPAVLLAALRDFPQGSAGPVSVKVQIGPSGMELRP